MLFEKEDGALLPGGSEVQRVDTTAADGMANLRPGNKKAVVKESLTTATPAIWGAVATALSPLQ